MKLDFEEFLIFYFLIFAFSALLFSIVFTKIVFLIVKSIKKKETVQNIVTANKATVSRFKKLLFTLSSPFKHLLIYPFLINRFLKQAKEFYTFKKLKLLKVSVWAAKNILLLIVCLIILSKIHTKIFTAYPNIIFTEPETGTNWIDYSKPIVIKFDIPVNQEKLILNMAPTIKGRWEFQKSFSFLPYSREVRFYPEETLFSDEKILIYLTDLSNFSYTRAGGEHAIEFQSVTSPNIVSIYPPSDFIDFPIDKPITIELNAIDGDFVRWDFVFDKEVDFSTARNFEKQIQLVFNKPLIQGQTYNLVINKTPLRYNISTKEIIETGEPVLAGQTKFTTVFAPLVSDYSPKGSNIHVDEVIKITFDNPMDHSSVENAFSITPAVDGIKEWEKDSIFVFKPSSNLSKATHYDFTLKQGIKSQSGGISETDIILGFDTIGKVRVIGWNPGGGSGNIKVGSNINVTFDQEVDHASAQANFSISPAIEGTFSWSGNTMVFNPTPNLAYSTKHTISEQSGVKSIYGLNSDSVYSSSFTTESQTFTLPVPLYRQTHAFTCNVTAIAMALAYKGVGSSEMSVYNGIAKDNTACEKSGSTITYWGNPNVGYVGDINGGGDCGGYGVNWGPSASYINSQGRSASIKSGWNVAGVANEVYNGNPVIVWWQNGWASPTWKSWGVPGGGTFTGLNGMHSEVVIGFIGSPDNPTHMITNDPWRGKRTLTVSQFNSLWNYFGKTAIVVY